MLKVILDFCTMLIGTDMRDSCRKSGPRETPQASMPRRLPERPAESECLLAAINSLLLKRDAVFAAQ
ncbi:hypothetical protein CUU66_10720 [Peribacillus deserti]|uniref:Uncharacterized protein n=1 Tax=Peribacillus deserti TaxID=673318 RepID=A0A2N5M676_9BACI|nr:hypothetical protein CUU66_10720 [Peribacillus deserti]